MVSKSHDKEDLILLRKTKQGVETNGTGGFVGVERWKRTDGSGSHRRPSTEDGDQHFHDVSCGQ